MKVLAGLGAMGMLGGGLYATDALTAGTVYDKPYARAYADLAAMPLLPVTGAAHNSNGSMVVQQGAGTISWRLSLGTTEVGLFTARLSPVGTDRTRVLVDFAATPPGDAQNPILSSELMTDFARLAMVEQVDASLEGRAPDVREIHMNAARHLQANPAQVKQFGQAVDAQFKSVNDMLRQDPAELAEWESTMKDMKANYGPPPRPEDATRPSVVFPQN